MARTHVQNRELLASRLDFLITTPEVLRLIHDITTCTVEWLDRPDLETLEASGGRELFPCFHHLSAAASHGSQGLHLS